MHIQLGTIDKCLQIEKTNTSPLVQKYNFKQQGGRQEKEIMPIDLPKQKSEL